MTLCHRSLTNMGHDIRLDYIVASELLAKIVDGASGSLEVREKGEIGVFK